MKLNNQSAASAFGRCALLLLALCAAPSIAHAQSALGVNGVSQIYIQRGQSRDLSLEGARLQLTSTIDIQHPRGLSITIVSDADAKKPAANRLKLHIAADADAALGFREVRLVSSVGVSPPIRVMVGQYPQIEEKEPNDSLEQAQDITFPVSLSGKIDKPGDIDNFRFHAVKGQAIVFDVFAARVRSQLDTIVSIFNEAGHELKTTVDQHNGDPTVIFTAPADGTYVLSVRDLQFRGGTDYSYQIDAGEIPYVQAVAPLSVQPGKKAELKPFGVNLTGAEQITLDLTYATPGDIAIRARASSGLSNSIKVAVDEAPTFVDVSPAHKADKAVEVTTPVDITGRIDAAGDDNFYKFRLARKQMVSIEAYARRMESPVEALISLRNATGGVMQSATSAAAEPMITRELPAGDYIVSIRDMFYGGGARYAYRLMIATGGAASTASAEDFAVRFQPDAIRVSRGSNSLFVLDLQRKGKFAGPVTVALVDPPAGVICPPVTIADKLPGAAGIMVVSARNDAALGTYPIHLRASAVIDGSAVSHDATALLDGRDVEQAYLTVQDVAPLTIDTPGALSAERARSLAAEADALATRLSAGNPAQAKAEAEWEKKSTVKWTTLKDAKLMASDKTELTSNEDGSISANVGGPDTDTYTVAVNSPIGKVTAVRLEALADERFGKKGPGRSGVGNFVLSRFTIMAGADPATAKPIKLRSAYAEVEQPGFKAESLIAAKAVKGGGWAINPRVGQDVEIIFFIETPADIQKDTLLTFTLDQNFGRKYTLGKFRLSVTDDADIATKGLVPPSLQAVIAKEPGSRSAAEKAKLAAFYRKIDPSTAVDAARVASIRKTVERRLEIARLEKVLEDESASKPDAAGFEKAFEAGMYWQPLKTNNAKAAGNAVLARQSDDSFLATEENPTTDTYTISAALALSKITAIRIEALPDASLPSGGPGRGNDGNFVLTGVSLLATTKPPATPTTKPSTRPANQSAEWKSAEASFEQKNYPASSLLDGAKTPGWAISPASGRPADLTLILKKPVGFDGGTNVAITLDFKSKVGKANLGRFRIWVTANPNPETAITLPPEIETIAKVTSDRRSDQQTATLSDYLRAANRSLEPLRYRLAELKHAQDDELTTARRKKLSIPFVLNRTTYKGPVTVSLRGFISQRDPITGAAAAGQQQPFRNDTVEVPAGATEGVLELEADRADAAARYAVLRVDLKEGPDRKPEFTLPFVLTVGSK